jgi:ribosomal protein L22
LVQFNTVAVTPLVERLSGRDKAMKEMAELLAKAAEEAKKEGGLGMDFLV